MVILDEKGKLFGKINIIDLLVIIVLIVGLAFGGYKILSRYFIHTDYENYVVVLRAEDVHPEMVDAIRIGDDLIERSGAIVGTVIEPRPYLTDSEVYVQNREGKIETSIQPKLKDLMITVLVKTPVGQRIRYNTNNLLIGSRLEYEFATDGTFKTIRYTSVKPAEGTATVIKEGKIPDCMNLTVIDVIPNLGKFYGKDGDGKTWVAAMPYEQEKAALENLAEEKTAPQAPKTPSNPATPGNIQILTQPKIGDLVEFCGKSEDGEGVGGSHMKALCVSIKKVAK